MPNDSVMSYVADLTVLLSWWKLQDGVGDGGVFQKLFCKFARRLYKRSYNKASMLHQERDNAFRLRLAQLQELEKNLCPGLDRVADTFASLLSECTPDDVSDDEKRILNTLLYHVGRYLYLVDAMEDLPKDQKNHNYNPLIYRYSPVDGKLLQEDKDSLTNTIEASIDMAASALELLEGLPNRRIVENIIYNGLPAVLKSVSNGNFRKRRTKNEGPI